MHRVLVDEDLPRSLVAVLRLEGFEAFDVREIGLRSASDDVIFSHSQSDRRTLVTGDLGFANILRFPLGSHFGLLVMRYPNEVSSQTIADAVVRALRDVSEAEIRGALLIVHPGGLRLRRPR